MATKIADNVYLGDSLDAELLQFENPLNITAVINVSLDADDPVDGIANIHVPMEDGDNPAIRKNHVPAARIRGRNGFRSVNP